MATYHCSWEREKTCRTGSGTRCKQQQRTTATAVSSEIRCPMEMKIGFWDPSWLRRAWNQAFEFRLCVKTGLWIVAIGNVQWAGMRPQNLKIKHCVCHSNSRIWAKFKSKTFKRETQSVIMIRFWEITYSTPDLTSASNQGHYITSLQVALCNNIPNFQVC